MQVLSIQVRKHFDFAGNGLRNFDFAEFPVIAGDLASLQNRPPGMFQPMNCISCVTPFQVL